MIANMLKCFKEQSKQEYRSDIDGLRAIACISVVIFHAFPEYLKGGFVGVDIFFVISGYLISSIIYRNLFDIENPGKLHLIDFYIKRVRRIFPALITILCTTLILGYFVLLPEEYMLLGKHVFGGSLYINNIMLFFESGSYFNPESNAKPLLHLWSLGVEEQFYLIFPIFLWIIYKTRQNFILVLTIFTITSFALCKIEISNHNQSAAFYLPWCRFWELSIGAILSYIVFYKKDFINNIKCLLEKVVIKRVLFKNANAQANENILNNILSIIGLTLIIIAIATIKNNYKFPGTRALLPVLGAIFIIAAGKKAFINRYILSNRIFVFLGLISYPLYLWHWPLLSFAYVCDNFETKAWIKIIAIIAAIGLSILTYLFIEPPLRYGKRKIFSLIFLLSSLYCIGFIGFIITISLQKEYKYEEERNSTLSAELLKRENECQLHFNKWNIKTDIPNFWFNIISCKMKSKEDNIALIGDSHAGTYYLGIANLFPDRKISVFPEENAAPFYDVRTGARDTEPFRENYKNINKALDYIRNNDSYKVVILAHTPLSSYSDTEYMGTDINLPYSKANSFPTLKIAIKKTVDKLLSSGKKVIFTLDNPALPNRKTNCVYRPITISFKPKCEFDKQFYTNTIEIQEYNRFIKNLINTDYPDGNVDFVDLAQILCDENKCYEGINNKPLYEDQNHLNQEGSNLVAPKIIQKIDKMLAN